MKHLRYKRHGTFQHRAEAIYPGSRLWIVAGRYGSLELANEDAEHFRKHNYATRIGSSRRITRTS